MPLLRQSLMIKWRRVNVAVLETNSIRFLLPAVIAPRCAPHVYAPQNRSAFPRPMRDAGHAAWGGGDASIHAGGHAGFREGRAS